MVAAYDGLGSLPTTIHEVLEARAAGEPDRVFLLGDEETRSFRDLDRHANRIAHDLAARGVRAGDHVLVMMPCCATYLAVWFAISKLGAVEVPVNPAYRGLMLRDILRTAEPRLGIVDPAFLAACLDAAEGLLGPADIVDPGLLAHGSPDLGGRPATPPARTEAPSFRDPSCVIFTSGTTGASKGVVMSHRHQLSFSLFFAEIVTFRPEDVAYNFLPFFHVAAKFQTLGAMLAGGRVVVRPFFSLSSFWDDVRRHGATLCVAVGGLCHLLNGAPVEDGEADNPLRLIYAVPIPWEFRESFERRFGLELVEGYGGTENNLVVYSRLGDATPRNSCGRASPHFEVAIRAVDGSACRPGEPGEICLRPRHPATMMAGYLGLPDKTVEAMDDYWFHTGDRGWIDGDGYVFFQDRLKDAIRRRGENISSFEVERILNTHPAVAECAVVPVRAELGEEEIKAVIVRKGSAALSAEDVVRFAVDAMPHFMVPRYVEFRTELPRTPTMKVRKVELREAGVTVDTWDCEKAGYRVTRAGLREIAAG